MKPLFLTCLLLCSLTGARADSIVSTARTNDNVLNDLVGRISILFVPREKGARQLSAIQELVVLHELKMRGEGLPLELATAFSENYSQIVSALVEDRIPEAYGRDLLAIHRELLLQTYEWMSHRTREEEFTQEVLDNLAFFQEELHENAISIWEVEASLRTPVINGYQVWIDELLVWSECHTHLNPGQRTRVLRLAEELERFEGYYKRDGVLQPYERELLHGRFLKVTQETIELIGT